MSTATRKPARPSRMLPAIAILVATFAVAGLGGLATSSSVTTWYAALEKPTFNPPNSVFGPVWTTLYALMAYAAWRAWRGAASDLRRRAMVLYAAQLLLNLLWSVAFFGLRQPALALVDIALLLMAILLTGAVFWRIDRTAGLAMAPYAAWVAFAGVLNFEIWRLN